MSIRVQVNLKGFGKVTPKVESGIKAGLKKIGLSIEREAKIRAPIRTGRLRSSIHTKLMRLKVLVKDGVFYGIFQELGTRFMKAQPFMKPAVLKIVPKIPSILATEIKRRLR